MENGWYGGWNVVSGALDENISLSKMGTYGDKSFGNSVMVSSGAFIDRYVLDDFPDVAGASYWVSFFIQLDTPAENMVGYPRNGGLTLANEAIDKYLYMGLKWQDGSGDDKWSILSSSNWTWYDVAVAVETGVPGWFVARVDMSGDSNDETATVWFNPDNTLDQLDESEAIVSYLPVNSLNDGLTLVTANCNGDPGLMDLEYDEIRLGTSWSEVKEMKTNVQLVADDELSLNNYPNPFSGSTTISYTLSENQYVKVSVYDAMGKEVVVLADEKQDAGKHELTFSSEGLANGLYVCKVQKGTAVLTKSMMKN